MTPRTTQDIRHFLHQQVDLWNAGKKQEMFDAFHAIVPGKPAGAAS